MNLSGFICYFLCNTHAIITFVLCSKKGKYQGRTLGFTPAYNLKLLRVKCPSGKDGVNVKKCNQTFTLCCILV